MKIVTASQMRQIEVDCAGIGITTDMLMENAGKAVAEEIKNILGNIEQKRITFLIGPGNNGGDGLVAARHLHDWGTKVTVYLCAERPDDDKNLKTVQARGIDCIEATEDADLSKLDELVSSGTAVIDALFGTGGGARPFRGLLVTILDRVSRVKKKRSKLRVIALDLPSGLNADTGSVDPACLHADNTITLGFYKPGLLKFPGAARVGKVTVADIGIPYYLAENITTDYISSDWVHSVLPERPLEANKGTFGKVLVIGGSPNYIGAPYLVCSGAMRVGAGLVTLATPSSLQPILASKLTEATYLPLPEPRPGIISSDAIKLIHQQFDQYNVIAIGCGLGQHQSVINLVKSLLFKSKAHKSKTELPSLVLDADALNILAQTPKWWEQLTVNAILTPHPGEMARLAETTVESVQSERSAIARSMAEKWHKTIVLKGANTVVATPDGQSRISPIANPGLASAGTGDVLTGVIAGLVAQGLSLFDAATCGVYLHAQAGEIVRAKMGDAGMIATDLLPALPLAIKQIKEDRS